MVECSNRLWRRKLVVALQISLCMVLLCAGGLLYRTLRNLKSSNLGMRTAGLLVFGISPQSNIRTDADAVRFHTALLERMRALPGVGPKTAACVLMFNLKRPDFPVDTHIHRISKRLGWIAARASAEETYERLNAIVPEEAACLFLGKVDDKYWPDRRAGVK